MVENTDDSNKKKLKLPIILQLRSIIVKYC